MINFRLLPSNEGGRPNFFCTINNWNGDQRHLDGRILYIIGAETVQFFLKGNKILIPASL
jgi:hypothetical protein